MCWYWCMCTVYCIVHDIVCAYDIWRCVHCVHCISIRLYQYAATYWITCENTNMATILHFRAMSSSYARLLASDLKRPDSCICEHKWRCSQCRECGGSEICEHKRVRSQYRECEGGSTCEHKRQPRWLMLWPDSSVRQSHGDRGINVPYQQTMSKTSHIIGDRGEWPSTWPTHNG